jgi:hypothetical protein
MRCYRCDQPADLYDNSLCDACDLAVEWELDPPTEPGTGFTGEIQVLDYSSDPRILASHAIESLARGRWIC